MRCTILITLLTVALGAGCASKQRGPEYKLETRYGDPTRALPTDDTARASWGFIDTKPGPGQKITPPEPTVKIEPAYPAAFRGELVTGEVVWRVRVDATGRVTQVEILSSDHDEFTDAVIAVAMSWKFTPATIDATPHPSFVMQRHVFRP